MLRYEKFVTALAVKCSKNLPRPFISFLAKNGELTVEV